VRLNRCVREVSHVAPKYLGFYNGSNVVGVLRCLADKRVGDGEGERGRSSWSRLP
jgi:hypothetical protein